ncbi:MAG: RnfABCDGE type electron transport complex subunit D [Candidatus Auribacterota bacterium]|nr:RnfABCDGE type electron transport complex subunit D [Candidatus Auribacterota bacterium]
MKQKEPKKLFQVSPSPQLHGGESIPRIMWAVMLSLLPALVASVYFFGWKALHIEVVSVTTAILTEALIQKLRKKPVTVSDGSAAVAGLLLAFNLPVGVPLWLAAVGAAFGIAVGKQAFGGLGYNIFNPALVGRVFVMHSWLPKMTCWTPPRTELYSRVDALTYATPLGAAKEAVAGLVPSPNGVFTAMDMFWGNIGGCIGETSVLALLIGGIFLLYRGYIRWETPVAFIGIVALLTWFLPAKEGAIALSPLYHVLGGGLMLGAIFMATDMVTTPVTGMGMFIFGLGCGLITVIIRLYGGFPEGVCYAILIMNTFTPLIDKFFKPRLFGNKLAPSGR